MQWQNPNGSTTNGVVIEDGAGNKLGTAANPLNVTGGGGGGGSVSATYNATLPTYGSGQTTALQATAKGALLTSVSDPNSGVGALVTAFHNSDNQAIGSTSYGMMTGGVAQLVNAAGNLDRQRETGFDGVPAAGVAAGAQQLAGPPLSATVTSGAITASTTPQAVTLSAVSFTNRGVVTTIQAGSELLVDAGASQETVYVSVVNTATKQVTAVFSKNHAASVGVFTFVYNQARDATIPDGSTPAGIAASAEYFYNASTSTVEAARSAAGELDGATGTGTPIAAEYEWNGGGPINASGSVTGLCFDRSRNLQAKGGGGSTLNGATSAGASSIVLNAVVGLQSGQQIRLDRGLGAEESAYVSQSYTPGSLTVALQSTLAQAHASSGTVDWDMFASAGPGLNGFTPAGIGIDEAALYDPVSGKYFIERAATQDNCPPQNVVLESIGLYNGSTMDRLREGAVTGSALVSPVDGAYGSATITAAGVVSGFPVSGNGYQSIRVTCVTAFTGTLYWEGSDDGTNWYGVLAGRLDVATSGSAASFANPVAGYIWDVPVKFSQMRLRATWTAGSGQIEWCFKAGPATQHVTVDQGAASASSSWLVQPRSSINGGLPSVASLYNTASGAATAIKASQGQIYGIDLVNNSGSFMYLHLFNLAQASVTLGTTSATVTYAMGPNSARFISFADIGLAFGTAITAAITGGIMANDNTGGMTANTGLATFHYN